MLKDNFTITFSNIEDGVELELFLKKHGYRWISTHTEKSIIQCYNVKKSGITVREYKMTYGTFRFEKCFNYPQDFKKIMKFLGVIPNYNKRIIIKD